MLILMQPRIDLADVPLVKFSNKCNDLEIRVGNGVAAGVAIALVNLTAFKLG